jgi:hypothetical protein
MIDIHQMTGLLIDNCQIRFGHRAGDCLDVRMISGGNRARKAAPGILPQLHQLTKRFYYRSVMNIVNFGNVLGRIPANACYKQLRPRY